MDSGNSGSMQSSSGGDEEYDSRSESISAAFMNSTGLQQPLQLHPSLHHHLNQTHHQSASLDPSLSNYLDPFTSRPSPNANPLLNFDMVWARGMRSEPNCTDTGHALLGLSSSSSQLILGSNHDSGRSPPLPNPSLMPLPQAPENGARGSSVTSDHQANNTAVRNSKKRSRASRRAPTTVLTTDTSNFRAMVQEFTGIPAAPFSSSSPFSALSRLHLFRSPLTTMRSGATHFEPTPSAPSHLLRPFAQKVQPPPFVSHPSFSTSKNMADGIVSTSNIGSTRNTSCTSNINSPSNFACTSNYQLLSELGLPKQTQNQLNMQNPILTFQTLLSSSPPTTNYPLPNVPPTSSTAAKSQALSTDSHLKMGLLEELDMNDGHVGANVGGLPNLVISDNNSSRWGDGVGLHDGSSIQVSSRSFNANYGIGTTTQQVNGCSSSDFHAEKASDQKVSSRGEGMVESWICSSD